MSSYLYSGHYDLVTPDGYIGNITFINEHQADVHVIIEEISPTFLGFQIDLSRVFFNLKSTLAQIGLNTTTKEILLDPQRRKADAHITIHTIGSIAKKMLPLLAPGAFLGKLFAADERRRVRDADYLSRMFGRTDRKGRPLLSLGNQQGRENLVLTRIEGRVVAFLTIQEGNIEYQPTIEGFLPTLAKLLHTSISQRDLLRLHQTINIKAPHIVQEDKVLLISTLPLHIRTVFGRVVNEQLPEGYQHTSADILQPDTAASGDIYELYGRSKKEICDIPLEFYTLEPHREYVFFSDRDQLQHCLEDPQTIINAFKTAPEPKTDRAATFIVKGTQLLHLQTKDWFHSDPYFKPFPGSFHYERQAIAVTKYIEQQPCYPFLKAIEQGIITSQGILLTRFFPSPLLKRMLLSYYVQGNLMGIYFQIPSRTFGYFFSQEDRAMLTDLATFGIPVFWVDETTSRILEYVQRPNKSSGMFVPIKEIPHFLKASFFGIYGSNLLASSFENELYKLLEALLTTKANYHHPLFNEHTPLALVTGGGPGAMEVGNKVARSLNILSCANIVDFNSPTVNEQRQNPYVDAKMTYRLDNLIERQAEFYLDFPIFVMGGVGTDFEFSLENVRQKVGARPASPILLFGEKEYWKRKITSTFKCNLDSGTIKGSEWIGNSFFCVQTAEMALQVYDEYFRGTLSLGPQGPIVPDGFVER